MLMKDPCSGPLESDFYAQKQVISALMRQPQLADEIGIMGEHFPKPECRRIVEVALSQHTRGEAFDEHTVSPHLDESERAVLADAIEEAGDLSLIPSYAGMLKRKFLLRNLNAIGASTVAATAGDEDPEDLIAGIHARLDKLQETGTRHKTSSAGEAAFRVEKKAIEAKRLGVAPGLPTGIAPLDEIHNPLRDGQNIVWAAATSMGKTALACNVAVNLAKLGLAVSYFTLEMSSDDLGARFLAGETGIAVRDIQDGRLSEDEVERLQAATRSMAGWPLKIEAWASMTPGQLLRRGRQHKRKYGTRLIIVDYIGLMRGKGNNFYEQISDITRSLKVTAGELSLPVIGLCQLNREVEKRSDGAKYEDRYLRRRPKLSDLRDSGSIEQDADTVLFVHREEVYLTREKPPITDLSAYQDWNKAMSRHKGHADLVMGKQRQGKTGLATCSYDDVRFRFGGLAHG
jgi:replicative DNA helicase